jgi:selenocysteine-specific elongation factor
VLVVAADESVMPQTREHFEICRLLRVRRGLIVLTKADLVDEETVQLVRLEVRDLAAGSFLADAPVLPVSVKTGQGLPELRDALVVLGRAVPGRQTAGVTRLPIDRVFSVRGFGTVVTGTLVSGHIGVEQELALLPKGRSVKVRGIQVHGVSQTRAVAGQRVAANLGGAEVDELARGDSLATPAAFEPTRILDVTVEVVKSARALRHGTRVRFHQGTSELLGRLAIVGTAGPDAAGEADTGGGVVPLEEVRPGARAYARVRLEAPAVVTRGDRFILRTYSPPTTIAGGSVLDPHPPRIRVRNMAGRTRFRRLDPASSGEPIESEPAEQRAVVLMVEESGAAGLPVSALTSRGGIPPFAIPALLDRLTREGVVARAGEVLIGPRILDDLKQRLLAMLAVYHRSEPLLEGMPREEARERLCGRAGPGVFERVIEDLTRQNRILGRDRLALPSHQVACSEDERRALTSLEGAFRAGGLKPPDLTAVATSGRIPTDVAERVVKLLMRQRILVRLDTLLFHESALARLRTDVMALKQPAGGAPTQIDVSTFKERYGVTRKFAIPLLEYLDRERVTKRVGDVRIVL